MNAGLEFIRQREQNESMKWIGLGCLLLCGSLLLVGMMLFFLYTSRRMNFKAKIFKKRMMHRARVFPANLNPDPVTRPLLK